MVSGLALDLAAGTGYGSPLRSKLRTRFCVRLTSVSSHLWHLMSGRMEKGSSICTARSKMVN